MPKIYYIVTMTVLFVGTALFTAFVFVPTVQPYEVVNVETEVLQEKTKEGEAVEEETPPTLLELWSMEENTTKIMQAQILNRELPTNWDGKETYFKYTYIGEYSPQTQILLDQLLLDEYKWQKQLDEKGNVVMGGIILAKDGAYQLHTHNTFTKAERFFLLGDLLDRYHTNGELVEMQVRFGNVTLENIWEEEIEVLEDDSVPYANLIISTCLERYGDKRLVSGWNIVQE
jgi:hypothetical protein